MHHSSDVPSLNEVVDGSIQLLLLHQMVAPLLFQLHHVLWERMTCQLNGCRDRVVQGEIVYNGNKTLSWESHKQLDISHLF